MEWNLIFFVNSVLLGVGLAMDAFSVSIANALKIFNNSMNANPANHWHGKLKESINTGNKTHSAFFHLVFI